MFGGAYHGRRVLLTGHTGFKGSWLARWLERLDAKVTGLALEPPTQPNHWSVLKPAADDRRADVRDADLMAEEVGRCQPEIVFHLAAQPLVRASYADPVGTWATNVMGTVSVLDACRKVSSVRAVVVVTTDKCYENLETTRAYREDDRLGGHDPYSASKAAAELVASSYRRAFARPISRPLIATARAGNVIGGGDWSTDRLVPDALRAWQTGRPLQVRSPQSVRPWQHVLDPLAAYLLLGAKLLAGSAPAARAWNFGPSSTESRTVENVLTGLRHVWNELRWHAETSEQPHEAALLQLDSTLARQELGWTSTWAFDQTIAATAQWYRHWAVSGQAATDADLDKFLADAMRQGQPWAR